MRGSIKEIAAGGKGPLVLHGGSGIDADDVKQAIRCGVVKVNIGAAIIEAWLLGLKEGAALDIPHYPRHYHAMRHAPAIPRMGEDSTILDPSW